MTVNWEPPRSCYSSAIFGLSWYLEGVDFKVAGENPSMQEQEPTTYSTHLIGSRIPNTGHQDSV